jgi:hypothetical protein
MLIFKKLIRLLAVALTYIQFCFSKENFDCDVDKNSRFTNITVHNKKWLLTGIV